MWNNTDEPLAYLITFRAFGTWLHGDDRTSVDRHNNRYGAPRIAPNTAWLRYNEARLSQPPVELTAARRNAITEAISDTCTKRNWLLHAQNIRTNHAHVVVTAQDKSPNIVMNAFKANATRQMREDGCWSNDRSPWVEKGSKRLLWNATSIERAVHYVLFGQGDDLPDFD